MGRAPAGAQTYGVPIRPGEPKVSAAADRIRFEEAPRLGQTFGGHLHFDSGWHRSLKTGSEHSRLVRLDRDRDMGGFYAHARNVSLETRGEFANFDPVGHAYGSCNKRAALLWFDEIASHTPAAIAVERERERFDHARVVARCCGVLDQDVLTR